jgi:hypothetical protein
MVQESQAVVPYNPRLQRPFHAMQMVHDIMVCEWGLEIARNPREVHDIITELELMLGLTMFLGDTSHYPQITQLLNRARVKSFQKCYARLQRCAALVDACNIHAYFDAALPLPSYDTVALAITAVDDVLPFVAISMKQYYIEDLRPSLVSVMEHYNHADDESVCAPIPRLARSKRCRPPKKLLARKTARVRRATSPDVHMVQVQLLIQSLLRYGIVRAYHWTLRYNNRYHPATYVIILVEDDAAVAIALQIMDGDENIDNLSFIVTISEEAFLTMANVDNMLR